MVLCTNGKALVQVVRYSCAYESPPVCLSWQLCVYSYRYKSAFSCLAFVVLVVENVSIVGYFLSLHTDHGLLSFLILSLLAYFQCAYFNSFYSLNQSDNRWE